MEIKIIDLVRYSQNGGVCVVKWEAHQREDAYEASVTGAEVFYPDPSSEDFVPYEDLTHDDVVSWLENTKGWTSSTQARLLKQIQEEKHPSILNGIPWAK